jgi:glucosamine--fructose-6-phosphate aminotransferase (isomerizing)
MNLMLTEIREMPQKAKEFLGGSPDYTLPLQVPYIGMGSSYFAPLSFKFMGINIYPEIASEYYNYLSEPNSVRTAVLLSQSGRSTEVLWCRELFEKYIAICNNTDSTLCKDERVSDIIPLLAGEEKFSSSKTYINTLLALFKGFGKDVTNALQLMEDKMPSYEEKGKALADAVFEIVQGQCSTGIYITGSGPNIGTALQAALIMSESTKLAFTGLPMAQYDHGTKETAKDSIVIQILSGGKSHVRTKALSSTIRLAGGHVFEVEEQDATENESVVHNIIPFNFMAYYLSQKLGVKDMFVVGGKVTEINQ